MRFGDFTSRMDLRVPAAVYNLRHANWPQKLWQFFSCALHSLAERRVVVGSRLRGLRCRRWGRRGLPPVLCPRFQLGHLLIQFAIVPQIVHGLTHKPHQVGRARHDNKHYEKQEKRSFHLRVLCACLLTAAVYRAHPRTVRKPLSARPTG